MNQIVECIPNFSEGRRVGVVEEIERALSIVDGIRILDRHMDPDHNRSVLTLAGHPGSLAESIVAGVRVASERIDLRLHEGEHPRTGATDVIPLVPLRNISMEACALLAGEVAARIAEELELPVYLYGSAARRSNRKNLEQIRKIGFERLAQEIALRADLRPDFGPLRVHPSAGATFVGARPILIAFNVNLDSDDLNFARKIASSIRESGGGLPGVKALGLFMNRTHSVQVSMNLTDYERTGIGTAYEAVRRIAEDAGISILGSELVGLAPEAALQSVEPRTLRMEGSNARNILEHRLAAAHL